MSHSLSSQLREAIRRKGLSANELARQAEVRPSFVYDILNGKSHNPSTVKMAKVCQILGTSLNQLMGIDYAPLGDHRDSKYVEISRILVTDTSRNSGGGTIQEADGEPFYYRRSWIEDTLQTKPEHLRIVTIEGDSMNPTLKQGDRIMIDTSRKNPSPPGIFILFDGMGLIAKRLEYVPQSQTATLRILSDNDQYQPYERPVSEIEIVGRVIWFAREI